MCHEKCAHWGGDEDISDDGRWRCSQGQDYSIAVLTSETPVSVQLTIGADGNCRRCCGFNGLVNYDTLH